MELIVRYLSGVVNKPRKAKDILNGAYICLVKDGKLILVETTTDKVRKVWRILNEYK